MFFFGDFFRIVFLCLALGVVDFILKVAGSIYIYNDSKKRNFASPILWAVFFFFFTTITIIIYLIICIKNKQNYVDTTIIDNNSNNKQIIINGNNKLSIFLICILIFKIALFIICAVNIFSIISEVMEIFFMPGHGHYGKGRMMFEILDEIFDW